MPLAKRTSSAIGSKAFVLDSSIALAWCFPDEQSSAQAVLDRLEKTTAIVPQLWHLEVGNALLMGERRKRSVAADTTQWLQYLSSLPIILDEEMATHAWSDTLILARSYQLSVYDAAYLELALRRGLPLATLDRHLQKAAKMAGVVLYAA